MKRMKKSQKSFIGVVITALMSAGFATKWKKDLTVENNEALLANNREYYRQKLSMDREYYERDRQDESEEPEG